MAAAQHLEGTVPAVVLPATVLVEAMAAVAAAGTRSAVAHAGLPVLIGQPGVRAAAVVERALDVVVVQASVGYECGTMAPGQRLPLDAGLPVTEAVRTGSTVVRGRGPSWVAVPLPPRGSGALLLSLHGAPPVELGGLSSLAGVLGESLWRAGAGQQALADVARLTAALAPAPVGSPRGEVVARSVPVHGPVGGDVLLCLPDGREGSWLVAADVCGSGLHAALVARSVAATVTAVAPYCPGPAALLQDLERCLAPVVDPDGFVTAVVVHLGPREITVASAGHPAPLLLLPSGPVTVDVTPGPPLALATGPDEPGPESAVAVPPGAVLMLHTDGLVDREGSHGLDPLDLVRGLALDDLPAAAEQVLAAAGRSGPAADDVSLMLVRPGPGR